jgi:hypothetical protein
MLYSLVGQKAASFWISPKTHPALDYNVSSAEDLSLNQKEIRDGMLEFRPAMKNVLLWNGCRLQDSQICKEPNGGANARMRLSDHLQYYAYAN